DAAVGEAIGLHAFEDFLRIMQDRAGRIELERLTRAKGVAVPALPLGIANRHHMIGVNAPEAGVFQQYGALVSRHSLAVGDDGEARYLLDVHDNYSFGLDARPMSQSGRRNNVARRI